jgi:hypothetical protein
VSVVTAAATAEIAATAEVTTTMFTATVVAATVVMTGVPTPIASRRVAIDALPTRTVARCCDHHESEKDGQRDDENERPTAHSPSASPDILAVAKTTTAPCSIPRVEVARGELSREPGHLTELEASLTEFAAFDVTFARFGRFEGRPATLYLEPIPHAPFLALSEAILTRFPAYPLYGGAFGAFGAFVAHLTVAQSDDALALERAKAVLARDLPLATRLTEILVMEEAPSADGGLGRVSAFATAVEQPVDANAGNGAAIRRELSRAGPGWAGKHSYRSGEAASSCRAYRSWLTRGRRTPCPSWVTRMAPDQPSITR